MKYLLLACALIAGQAMACPDAKEAMAAAPSTAKPVVAAKAKPATTTAATKAVTKVAAKPAAAAAKTASL